MCVRRYEDSWEELKRKPIERDVLEVLSFSAFVQDESDPKEKLRYRGEKDIHIQVKDARITPDVYLELPKQKDIKRQPVLTCLQIIVFG